MSGDAEVLILRPSKAKWILFLLGSSAFVFFGAAFMLPSPSARWQGWFVISFFGLCSAIFALNLLPASSWLRLTREGFQTRTLFRDAPAIPWTEVGIFSVARVPPFGLNKMVIYEHSGTTYKKIAAINRRLVGTGAGLPDTFGYRAEKLAAIMNEWRGRSVGNS